MPASSSRATDSSSTSSARSMAGSGSERKKRFFVLSAGATTSTSARSASSLPTAERRASAEIGSATRARIFLAMPGLYRTARQAEREHELNCCERQLQGARWQDVRELRSAHHADWRKRSEHEPRSEADIAVLALAPRPDDRHRND